ncbi:hypothetical protein QNH20_23150 [Neobacillus sp. WH10]|uniref:hypothetical protein n=1 Tax=Neobacillus sp. WH10 TaxID=3047873 RepID=UPI0024C110BF|nr:hypothetical protein [Neobacillus sp. WH10]WHY76952.1 hypothetical protein QNH20_23150 [Neobacillus sp. WH10]
MDYQTIFYGGLAGSILSLIISIVVFIKLNISEVIEDLTGFSFHKWVKKQRGRSRSKQEQNNKPITREIQPRRDVEMEVAASSSVDSTELLDAEVPSSVSIDSTELLGTEIPSSINDDSIEQLEAVVPSSVNIVATELLEEKITADATELLAKADSDETELLSGDAVETELLSTGIDETELLNEGMEETTVLTAPVSDSKFIKERDVVIVHTNATI